MAMLQNNMIKLVLLCLVLVLDISNATNLPKNQECEIRTFSHNASNQHFIYLQQWQGRDYRNSLWICNTYIQQIDLDKNTQAKNFCKNVTLTLGLFCNQTVQENQIRSSTNITEMIHDDQPYFGMAIGGITLFGILLVPLIAYVIWKRRRRRYRTPRTQNTRYEEFCDSIRIFFNSICRDENNDTCQNLLPIEKYREEPNQVFFAYSPIVSNDQVNVARSQEWSSNPNGSSVNSAASPIPNLASNRVEYVQKSVHSNYVVEDKCEVEPHSASTKSVSNLGGGNSGAFDGDKNILSVQENMPISYSNATASINVMSDPGCAGYAQESGNRKNINNNYSVHFTQTPIPISGSSQDLSNRTNFFEEHSAASSIVDSDLNRTVHVHKLPNNQDISEFNNLNSLLPVLESSCEYNDPVLVEHQTGVNNDGATFRSSVSNLAGAESGQEMTDYRNFSHDDETGYWTNPIYRYSGYSQYFFKDQNIGGSITASSADVNNVCAQASATEDKNETLSFQDRDPSSDGNDQPLDSTNCAWYDTGMTSSSKSKILPSDEDNQELLFSQNASGCSQAMTLRRLTNDTENDERHSSSDFSEGSITSFETASYESASASLSSGGSGYVEGSRTSSDDADQCMNGCLENTDLENSNFRP